jgi:hypothetical protein
MALYHQPQDNIVVQDESIQYVDTTNLEPTQSIVTDPIYVHTRTKTSVASIYHKIKKQIPNIDGSEIGQDSFVEVLRNSLSYMVFSESKWNFLAASYTIAIADNTLIYKLPPNYHKIISIYFSNSSRRSELQYVDYSQKDFVTGNNFYTLFQGTIELIRPTFLDRSTKNFGACQLYVSFYEAPKMPTLFEEIIEWFPSHPAALELITELTKERVYRQLGQVNYTSPETVVFMRALMDWDSNLNKIENKVQHDRKIFDVKGILNQRYPTRIRRNRC